MQRQVASFANRSRYQNHKPIQEVPQNNGLVKTLRINISNIHMADYQRNPSEARIRRIVNEYDPHRDRPIELSYRAGKFWS